jgi:hypothetical protein
LDAGVKPGTLSKRKEKRPALVHAVEEGHAKIVKLLIQRGANINVRDVSGNRPLLILAAEKGHVAVVDLLFHFGVDVNTKDREGRTAMEIAKKRGDLQVISLLRTHHAYEVTPKIEKFLESAIVRLSKIFEVTDARTYIESELGEPKEVVKIGEEPDSREPGIFWENNRWIYDGISFEVVSQKNNPSLHYSEVRKIELFASNYELMDELRIGLSKQHFIEKLGSPLSNLQTHLEYRVQPDGYYSPGSYNHLLLRIDEMGLVKKLIWTHMYPFSD